MIDDLVEAIYAAALDPVLWASCLDRVSERTASDAGWFMWHDDTLEKGDSMWLRGVDETVGREYPLWASRNIYMQRAGAQLRTGTVMRAEDLVPDRDVFRSEFYDGFLRRAGIMHHLGVSVFLERSLVVAVMLAKQIGAKSHTDRQLALVRRLVPHLQRAVAIQRRLAGVDLEKTLARDALDRMPIGILFLAGDGRVTFSNQSAERIFRASDGLSLTRDARLTAARPSESSQLQKLIDGACKTGTRRGDLAGGALSISRPSLLRPFAVLVSPLRPASFALAAVVPAAVVFLSDPEREVRGVADLLQSLYGLTPAESAVATLLLDGKRVADIQDVLSITENTARTHVRRVLEKVQARGQGDMIRMLLTGPAGLVVRGRSEPDGG